MQVRIMRVTSSSSAHTNLATTIEFSDLVVADRLVSEDLLKGIKCEVKVANKRPGKHKHM